MVVIIDDVILQPTVSQKIILHAKNTEACRWRTHSRNNLEIYANVITEYDKNEACIYIPVFVLTIY
jgi:hypothetical protein